ncbi:MAG TPA: AMP-binding protein [Streptosporangiaceae bacterium]|nr:AMP-binding protein [Streptosporangiaceae bacterium]
MTGAFGSTVDDYTGTIPGLLDRAVARDPDGIWLRTDDLELSFAAAAARVGATAADLARAGVGHGDLVMVTARTTPEYLLSWLALARLGAVAVAVNPASAAAEIGGLVRQVRPRAVLTDPGLRGVLDEAGAGEHGMGMVIDVNGLGAGWPDQPASGLPRAEVGPDDLAVLIPTSGTTGRSKLVMQTHRAYAMAGEGFPYWMELTARDRLMTSLPLFHINAPIYSVLGSLACGAGLILVPRFSASGFLDSARRHGATEFNAIGAMLEILMRQPERPDDADNPLRLCYAGPAPERARQQEIERRFGIKIVIGYAMSESPYGLVWPRGRRPYGTLGAVRQHPYLGIINEAKAVAADDPEDPAAAADGQAAGGGAASGPALGPGETGEILLRNPVIMRGYWGMPEETAAVLTADGWLRTGDLATVNEDGTYTFVGRRKEVLRRRGENLSPLEVEEVLDSHPAVLESAVVGVASELTEDEVKAFVVPAPSARIDLAELREYAAVRLSAFKVPRFWQLLDELPRTPTARIAKHRLPAGHQPGEFDAEAQAPTGPDGR